MKKGIQHIKRIGCMAFALFFLLSLVPCLQRQACAAVWDTRIIHEQKKEWTVHFNQELNPSVITPNNIYIVNDQGIKISPATLKAGDDQKSAVISPADPYEEGKTYSLHVQKDIQSVDGTILQDNITLPFIYKAGSGDDKIPVILVPGTMGVWPKEYYDGMVDWGIEKSVEYETLKNSASEDGNMVFSFWLKYGTSMMVADTFRSSLEKVKKDEKKYLTNGYNEKNENKTYYIDPLMDTYVKLLDELQSTEYGYEKDENLFVFGYDTLETDIHTNGKNLYSYVKRILTNTGASKVRIIAHSQGNLVARSMIQEYGGDSLIDKFIMVAPPNRGVTKMYGIYYFGSPKTSDLFVTDSSHVFDRNAIQSATSLDDLLISLRALMVYDNADETSKITFVQNRLKVAKDMLPTGLTHFSTNEHNAFLNALNNPESPGYQKFIKLGQKVAIVCGNGISTVSYYKDGLLGQQSVSEKIGDGVVTFESTQFEADFQSLVYNKVSHSGFLDGTNTAILHDILKNCME